MPKKIGVREFKQRASEVLREVREASVAYDVTYRGEVIANLVPVPKQEKQLTAEEWIAAADAMRARIEATPVVEEYKNMSAVELVREGRDRDEHVLEYLPNHRAPRPTDS